MFFYLIICCLSWWEWNVLLCQIFFGFWFWTIIIEVCSSSFPLWVKVRFVVCWLSLIFLTTWTQFFGLFEHSVVSYFGCSLLNFDFFFEKLILGSKPLYIYIPSCFLFLFFNTIHFPLHFTKYYLLLIVFFFFRYSSFFFSILFYLGEDCSF